MNNKDHLVGQLTKCTFDMPSKSSGVHQVPVGTSGYQCTRYTKKTKTKSAVLPTSLMSFLVVFSFKELMLSQLSSAGVIKVK